MPGQAEALGLHALLLAHDARREARVDAAGALVLFEDQDRALWDRGRSLRPRGSPPARCGSARRGATRCRPRSPSNTSTRRRAADTRWGHIVAYYSHLAALGQDPVVELNWAVAIAMAGDLDGGLARIDALAPALDGYQYFYAARADLLRRSGARAAAAAAYARALRAGGQRAPSARSCDGGSTSSGGPASDSRATRTLIKYPRGV